jgi:uncharacterized membrane protein (DUF2068 family)
MRPLGVTLIAALTWVLAVLWTVAGVTVIGFSHLGARMLSTLSEGNLVERFLSSMGTLVGVFLLAVAAVYVVVGMGLWKKRNWARELTLFFAALGLLLGLRSLIDFHHLFRVVRTVADAAIIVYLLMPEVKKVFA